MFELFCKTTLASPFGSKKVGIFKMWKQERIGLIIGWAFFLLFFLSGCSFSLEDLKAEKREQVRVALAAAPQTLDPRLATDANGMRIVSLLFQPLVRLGPELKLQPSAAHKWSFKNKEYLFFINKDLKFSNGRNINKEDLLFSLKEYRSKRSRLSSAFQIISHFQVLETAQDFLLKIQLKKKSAKFLQVDLPVLKILPKQEVLLAGKNFQKKPIGTGPFSFVSQNSSQIVLKARTDIPEAPRIKKVVFKIIRDELTRFQKVLKGEIDVAQSEISFQKIPYFLKKKSKFNVFRRASPSVTYLLFNLRDECLKLKHMRKALTLSIDSDLIIKHKLKGFAKRARTILNPENFFFNKNLKNFDPNFKEARRLLKNLPVACLQKRFSLKTSNTSKAINHGRVLALQLRKQGLNLKLESFEWGTFFGDVQTGRFQLALLKWVGALDPDIYRVAFHSSEVPPRGRNRGFYQNPLLDQLLDRGIITLNRKKRQLIYNKVQKIVQDEYIFIPLWHEEQIAVVKKNISNYHLGAYGDFSYLSKIFKSNSQKNGGE